MSPEVSPEVCVCVLWLLWMRMTSKTQVDAKLRQSTHHSAILMTLTSIRESPTGLAMSGMMKKQGDLSNKHHFHRGWVVVVLATPPCEGGCVSFHC